MTYREIFMRKRAADEDISINQKEHIAFVNDPVKSIGTPKKSYTGMLLDQAYYNNPRVGVGGYTYGPDLDQAQLIDIGKMAKDTQSRNTYQNLARSSMIHRMIKALDAKHGSQGSKIEGDWIERMAWRHGNMNYQNFYDRNYKGLNNPKAMLERHKAALEIDPTYRKMSSELKEQVLNWLNSMARNNRTPANRYMPS